MLSTANQGFTSRRAIHFMVAIAQLDISILTDARHNDLPVKLSLAQFLDQYNRASVDQSLFPRKFDQTW